MAAEPTLESPDIDLTDSALLIVDIVNDHVMPEGAQSKWGKKKPLTEGERSLLLSNIQRLIAAMRTSGRHVIYVHTEVRLDDLDSAHAQVRRRQSPFPPGVGAGITGTWGADFCEEISPIATDIVIGKKGNSGFGFTDLDQILRRLGVTTLVATGGGVPGCLSDTVRQATNLGYDCVVAGDATYRPPNGPMLRHLGTRVSIESTSEILTRLEAGN
jgi:nicotinamidase-related amidase